MTTGSRDYVLGRNADAARRLAIQDAQFATVSELLLDDLPVRPDDRVVEIGTGAGGFSRRVLKRLGSNGVLVGVDYTPGLLEQAKQYVAGAGEAASAEDSKGTSMGRFAQLDGPVPVRHGLGVTLARVERSGPGLVRLA